MGEHPVDHNSDKTKGSMENLENSLTHLRGQMINILRQQEYQRVTTPAFSAFTMTVMLSSRNTNVPSSLLQEKEESFRQISEDTNSKVLWWALMQTFILLSVGYWQMKRLKDFFIAKKLV